MKISDVTLEEIKKSVGYSADDMDDMLELYKTAAEAFVCGYTGLTAAEIDAHEDLTIAVMCLIGDMFENRYATVENDKLNPTVRQLLAMYAVNHVGGVSDESV